MSFSISSRERQQFPILYHISVVALNWIKLALPLKEPFVSCPATSPFTLFQLNHLYSCMAKHSKGSALELNWPGHTQQPWLTVMAYGYGDGQLRDAFSTMQDPLCQTRLLSAAAGSSAATGALGREPSNEDLLERWWSTIKLLLLKWNKAKIWHSTSACSRENCWAWLWFWQSLGHKTQAASYP